MVFSQSIWTAIVDKMLDKDFVVSLPIRTKSAAKQEDIREQGIAVGFLVEGFLVVG